MDGSGSLVTEEIGNQAGYGSLDSVLRHSPIRFWVLALVTFTWVGVRLGGPHLHLCFDGMESSSSLHAFDGTVHHTGVLPGGGHDDVDIDLAGDGILKVTKLDAGLFIVVLLFLALGSLPRQAPAWHQPRLLLASLILLRPPVRGPPIPNSP